MIRLVSNKIDAFALFDCVQSVANIIDILGGRRVHDNFDRSLMGQGVSRQRRAAGRPSLRLGLIFGPAALVPVIQLAA